MKKILLSIFMLLALASCSKDSQSVFNIKSYIVNIKYDTTAGQLNVQANLFVSLTGKQKDELLLFFTNKAKIKKLQLVDDNKTYTAKYKLLRDTIIVNIPKELIKSEQLTLKIDYYLPAESFLNSGVFCVTRGSYWIPYNLNDIVPSRFEIQVPVDYVAYSSGDLLKSSTDKIFSHYTWQNMEIPGLLLVIAPKNFFNITTKIINNKELIFYFINKDTVKTNVVINEVVSSFNSYMKIFGDYKFRQFRFYELPTGMNHAMAFLGSVVFGDKFLEEWTINYKQYTNNSGLSIKPQKITTKDNESFSDESNVNDDSAIYENSSLVLGGKYTLAHETAHEWVGGGFNYKYDSKYFKFITEGLTEYVRYLYIEYVYGSDSLNNLLDLAKSELKIYLSVGYNSIPLTSNSKISGIPYLKGPLVFHYVRQKIGKDNFISFIRTLYSKYYGKVIDYEIFKAELSKYDKTGRVIKRMEEMTEMKGMLPEN